MMYFINITLTGGNEEAYKPLIDAIKALGPWSNRMQNTFLVECPLNAVQIRDLLKPHLKANDRLFVGEFTRNWAATNMGAGFPEWIGRRRFRTIVPLEAVQQAAAEAATSTAAGEADAPSEG
jgi:hypothetical protein